MSFARREEGVTIFSSVVVRAEGVGDGLSLGWPEASDGWYEFLLHRFGMSSPKLVSISRGVGRRRYARVSAE